MPIGVPKTGFRIPGDEDASWIDLYNRLYRERLIFLGKEIDSEIANQITSLMVFLSMEDETKDQYMFINSPGGWVTPGLAIYDTMQYVKADVQTINMGLAASVASFILAGGTPTKRIAFPHARVMIHQPASVFEEVYAVEVIMEAKEVSKMRENITKIFVKRTNRPLYTIVAEMERDSFMSAEQAQELRIIDLITSE
uniref:ATP-dependent Clp protease proteolytic subunit n=2 Tax=Bauhiniinae TaxID=2115957 RepID=A0A2S0SV20_9FABA|nr:clp protease proteolytic subunit [Bauhinia binata]YP_009486998.1 clp protease proteolytic subunit [Lysiphyllum hookeri]AWB12876.1 clp protease proteolytic subunit [Bauhinia binata]AWB13221.1 clp protease proteolytic subunit [Lysiphyllum hookeri]